jgi:TPR repeat protein
MKKGLVLTGLLLGALVAPTPGITQTRNLQATKALAEQGDAKAQFDLGFMYDLGLIVPQDYQEAVKWYRKAAEQGYTEAHFSLSYIYFQGRGVLKDYVQAHMWLNLAAAKGLENAAQRRDLVASQMTPEQIAEAQRLAKEWIEKHEKEKGKADHLKEQP